MQKALISFISAGVLFSAGCSQPPPDGPSATPKPPKPVASATQSAAPSATASATPSATPSAAGSATPEASATPSGTPGTPAADSAASPEVQKFIEATHLDLKIPFGFKQEVKKDGEIQFVDDSGDFAALQIADKTDEAFDAAEAVLKAAGKESYKAEGAPQTAEHEGVKGKMHKGTMDVGGTKMTWVVMVFDAGGGKVLRLAAMGPKLMDSPNMKALVESIKKK